MRLASRQPRVSPKSAPCGPVERSLFPLPGNVGVQRTAGGLCQSYLPRLDGLLNSKLALCRYMTAAVQAGSAPPRGQSDRSTFRFIGTCRNLGTYSMYIQTRQVFLGRWNEVGFLRFPSPPFGSLFILFPVTRFFFLFFSFMSSLASCPVISSLSFCCVHTARPLVCTCTTYVQIRFQVSQVFTMRWVVIGCSCALGSFSLQPHTHTFVPSCLLFMSSFFCLTARALTHLPALTLVFPASPREGVSV